MKALVALCVLALVALSTSFTTPPYPHPRGCIYIDGQCYRECEEGTHAYTTGCDRIMPEPTCAQPNPVEEKYETCDFTACYCDPPTVRDITTKKCVTLDKCPPSS